METKLYYLETRYYDPGIGRFLNPDTIDYLGDGGELNNYNLFAYCGNNPVMYSDPTGHVAVSVTAIGAVAGAILGAIIGGIVAYNIAKDNNIQGLKLIGATVLGVIGGAVAGGVLGAAIGSLITKITGVRGFSITKHSCVPIKDVTILGHYPEYVQAAKATKSGYYDIPTKKYNYLKKMNLEWINNRTYLKDANSLGSQFVIEPNRYLSELNGGALLDEIRYLIENCIPWFLP